ncbi:hypothetical protein GIB67_000280 [Kingdonia uniflora]|uniref:Exocyst complex component Sec8 n=1 Tax=Kingdonia uniflora TaxID=39325 RepID=A0A7J7LCE0_9MAGN|nr:hypothetical protein GIB67_000280 [Kingdonia uniflora]
MLSFSLCAKSECQQLICEILRATPEAASADAAVQTARLANKAPTKEKRDGSEDGLTFAFRFTDATISIPNQVEKLGYIENLPKANKMKISQTGLETLNYVIDNRVYIPITRYDLFYHILLRAAISFVDRIDSPSFVSGVDLIRQGWSKRGPNVLQEGYGTAAVLPEQGIYLAASIYRPVLQFTDKVASLLPQKYSQLGNDGLLSFVENFLKDHFLPTMFVDYRKGVQQAISSKSEEKRVKKKYQTPTYIIGKLAQENIGKLRNRPAAFRPRAHTGSTYNPLIEKGRPVLQGLLAIDFLAKEVLGWAQAMPKYAGDLVKYVQTFLERTYERCRASYMEACIFSCSLFYYITWNIFFSFLIHYINSSSAVLEKQSYMLIGRHDIEGLMRLDPASVCLPNSSSHIIPDHNDADAETVELDIEICDLLLSLRPIKQENLIRDDNKLILLASLSDSLEYVADSIERLGKTSLRSSSQADENQNKAHRHTRTNSAPTRDLTSFANEYRRLAVDCLKVLRVEMQLETIFHMQEMTVREYLEDQDAEEPDDFIISLTAQITRRDEEMAPFVAETKRNYIFGGICSIAANSSVKALTDFKSINLFGVQQICRNSIALEQALAAIPSINSEAVQQRLDHVRTYYELLNLPFEALLAFITEHEYLFTASEYSSLLKVKVPGRDIPTDAQDRVSEILSH